MSTASSESEKDKDTVASKLKVRKTKKERDVSQKDEEYEESLQEKLCHLLSTDESEDSTNQESEEGSEDEDLDQEECTQDFNLIADALESSSRCGSFNKTFSDQQLREIERKNAILMNKILSHNKRPAQYKVSVPTFTKISNSSVNRKKQQQKIDHDNLLLLKKINSVKPFGMSKSSTN